MRSERRHEQREGALGVGSAAGKRIGVIGVDAEPKHSARIFGGAVAAVG
jgi:hypothetical protein